MKPSRKLDWQRIGKIYTFSSRRVFEEIRPPSTPILLPALFVVATATLIPWLLIPIVFSFFVGETTYSYDTMHPLLRFGYSSMPAQLLLVNSTAISNAIDFILIGTYFFVVARCSGIKILWEQWFGFTCWAVIPIVFVHSAASFLSMYSMSENPAPIVTLVISILFCFLPILWIVSLSAQGLRIWTSKSWIFCIGWGIIPYVVLFDELALAVIKSLIRASW